MSDKDIQFQFKTEAILRVRSFDGMYNTAMQNIVFCIEERHGKNYLISKDSRCPNALIQKSITEFKLKNVMFEFDLDVCSDDEEPCPYIEAKVYAEGTYTSKTGKAFTVYAGLVSANGDEFTVEPSLEHQNVYISDYGFTVVEEAEIQ